MTRPLLPYIGWDPTPGDVEQTRGLARKLGGLAAELGTALHELEQIECGEWKGKTALAFTEHISTDVTPLIRKSHDSFDKASRALHRWAGQLQEFQDETDRAEKQAEKACNAKDKAEADTTAKRDLGPSSQLMLEAEGVVDDLMDRYKTAAALISKDLDKAADLAPDEPNFWHKLGHDIAEGWDATGQWIKDHADTIKLVGDILSDVTTVLGILAIATLPFEPLGAIFGAAALVTSGLALLSHSVAKAAGADVSWMSVGLDSLGLLPGVGALGKGVKVVDEAAAGIRAAGEFGKGFQASKLAAGTRNIFATGELAGKVEGGLALFGKKVALGGKFGEIGFVSHESSNALSRLAGLGEAGYHQGQMMGSKGLKIISGSKLAIDPLSAGGRALDATLKIAPKLASIPQHIGDAVNPGDRFHEATASH